MPNGFTPRFTLLDMCLDAVALCGQGANSRAHILLSKSMKEGNSKMEINEILSGLSTDAQAVVTKHITDTVDAAVTKAVAEAVAPLNTEIENLKATNKSLEDAKNAKVEEPAPADFAKSLPDEARKQFEEMQKSIQRLEAEKAESVAKSRFEIVKAIPCEADTLKSVLKTASPEVFDVLVKAAAAIEAGLGDSKAAAGEGKLDKSADDYYAELETIASNIAKSDNLSPAQAFTKACEQNPELYKQYSNSQH